MCSGMVASDSDGMSARLQEGFWGKKKQERGQKKTRQTRWRLIGAQRALPCRQPAARMLSRRPSRLCNCSCQAALFLGACASCRSGPSSRILTRFISAQCAMWNVVSHCYRVFWEFFDNSVCSAGRAVGTGRWRPIWKRSPAP